MLLLIINRWALQALADALFAAMPLLFTESLPLFANEALHQLVLMPLFVDAVQQQADLRAFFADSTLHLRDAPVVFVDALLNLPDALHCFINAALRKLVYTHGKRNNDYSRPIYWLCSLIQLCNCLINGL